ncbi:glycosyltransferase family 92 protein RCOM_0530710 [Diospyros lotus]|uniref:glycosyltransferase family 92 protein RCOM_0530710 n=1 Tax=Diospyros lotus TaxID=55363 RepID=UPI0022546D91|nr:glycosyltransferase family 92 protein RCOM_0530710 [Diospyros lotus]
MKGRKRKGLLLLTWNYFFICLLVLVFVFGFAFSTTRLLLSGAFHPQLISSWRIAAIEAVSSESPAISVSETVVFPDQALIFLKYPPSTPLFTKDDIDCVYLSPNSSESKFNLPPVTLDSEYLDRPVVRCPLRRRGLTVSVAVKPNGHLPPGPTHRWDSLAYEAMIDRDNSTIVFVKGLNLRARKAADPSRFECVYGWDFTKPKLLLRSEVISIAQEIVRCKTPLSILTVAGSQNVTTPVKVSVRRVGRPTLRSVARPSRRLEPDPLIRKQHEMCVCTMLRNQARFLREWVMYHARIGVQRWFIYDNNSDDGITDLIDSLSDANFNITRHFWPWIKTQEAGFAHCAIRARASCEWVGFIDVDEFLHFPSNSSLHEILANQSSRTAELRVWCHSFGPSGLKRAPVKGVTVGYTCRMAGTERHKSIVKPEALNSSLINMVHHFHLASGFGFVDMDINRVVINHYKYQVWEAFKEKFYRRVATYVSDWQEQENVGSKDRTPGLGTRAVEPPDWSSRFCEVLDTGLRDWVLDLFGDPETGILPWQEHLEEAEQDQVSTMVSEEEPKQSPPNPNHSSPKVPDAAGNGDKVDGMFSPRFRSVAAMAGWDEEALLIASLVVEDTPDRDSKHKKRSDLQFKSPPTNSRRKRRAQRKSPVSAAVPVLDLGGEDEESREGSEKNKVELKPEADEEKKIGKGGQETGGSCSSSNLPCMDQLRQELSCAICLEICFEPSTTSCGHSFCKKCLRSAAEKCGKRCPKCRQLISNGRSCTVNTVLWNTIQLLFPQEVEARKVAAASNSRQAEIQTQTAPRRSHYNARNQSIQALNSPEYEGQSIGRGSDSHVRLQSVRSSGISSSSSVRRRTRSRVPSQDEDAALALRLQREEFMEAFRDSDDQHYNGSSIALARANLRAMASRAINIRLRGRPT